LAHMIALHQIATREKKGGPRIVIAAGSRFNPLDYPMISDKEWEAMYKSTPPIIRHPDDPAFSAPAAQQAAAAEPVTEGRSPRTDLEKQAAAAAKREDEGGNGGDEGGDGDGGGDPEPRRRGRRRAADDEV